MFRHAEQFRSEGDWQSALEKYEGILAQRPTDKDAIEGGVCCAVQGQAWDIGVRRVFSLDKGREWADRSSWVGDLVQVASSCVAF